MLRNGSSFRKTNVRVEPFEAHHMLCTRRLNKVAEFDDRIEFRLAEPGDDCVLTLWRATGEWSLPDNWMLGPAAKREALREALREADA